MRCPKCNYDLGAGLLPPRCPACSYNLSHIHGKAGEAEGGEREERGFHPSVAAAQAGAPKIEFAADADLSLLKRRQVLAIFIVVVGVLLTAFLVMNSGIFAHKAVPDLVGVQKEYAIKTLKREGLAYTIEERYADMVSGMVIAQSPDPDTPVQGVKSVKLIISRQRLMPDLVGLTQKEAEARLAEQGLKARVVPEYKYLGSGKVVRQNIQKGMPVTTKRDIQITVEKPYVVPGLVGKSLDEALEILGQRHMGYHVTYVFKTPGHPDPLEVVTVSPGQGTPIKKRSRASLQVVMADPGTASERVREVLHIIYDCDPNDPKQSIGKNLRPYVSPNLSHEGKPLREASDRDIWYDLVKGDKTVPGQYPQELESCPRALVNVEKLREISSYLWSATLEVRWDWSGLGGDHQGLTTTDTRDVTVTLDKGLYVTAIDDHHSDVPIYQE